MSTTAMQGKRFAVRGLLAGGLTALLVATGATTAFAAGLPSGPSATGLTGSRPSATKLSFTVSDRTSVSVDVGTGNLNVASSLLALPGVAGTVPIGVAYNSRDTTGGSPTGGLKGPGPGWTWALAGAGSLSQAPDGSTIDYTTSDGAVFPFKQSSGVFTSPAGLKAMLVRQSDTTYTLMFLTSRTTITFSTYGDPTSVTDRNGNKIAISPWSGSTASVTSTAGPTAARTATLSYANNATTVSQTSGGSSRSAKLSQASDGSVLSLTDPAGGVTSFAYGSGGLLSQITGPTGATESFVYDSSRRVTQVDQSNTTSGSAGTSTTRFLYQSSTSTLVAGPNTSTATAVGSVPHATYTLDGNLLVTKAIDAANRTRSATYTSQGLDVASSTTGASGGSPASVATTYGYDSGINSGQSLTSITAQGGNKSTASYGNSGNAQYLPSSSSTDTNVSGGSNTTSYTYNGAGNQLTSTGNTSTGSTSSSTAVTSSVTRNSDGTIATATSPGNGSNSTRYTYSNGLLSQVTPVSGSSLGTKTYSYDDFGRLRSQSDGAGRTTTYGYDNDDRVTSTSFSDGTQTVMNTWDKAGNLTGQTSAGGTITNSYDQLGQLYDTKNSSGGGDIYYKFDAAGNNISLSDSRGTTVQYFDETGVLRATKYNKNPSTAPNAIGQATTYFKTDSNGNRTDTWLQGQNATNYVPTDWAARTHTDYATNGRVSRITAFKGDPSSETKVMDVYYCYNTSGSTTSCGSSTGGDASKLQYTYNGLTSQTTRFTYDGLGRLTKVAESGGSKGNSTYAYTYDPRGNRLTAAVSGSKSSNQTLTYNAANQITSSGYTYDGAGNLTASPTGNYTYNAAAQMTSATVSGNKYSYTYAGSAQNAVLSETGGGHTYKIVYGLPDQVGNPTIAQYQVDGKTAYVEQDPVTGQATMLHTSSDIAALYIYDGLGSPVALLTDFSSTSFQYSYDPYGLPTLEADSGGNGVGQNPYAFKSGIQDRATGFVKFGARWYNPATGTWTQQDAFDSPLDSTNANRYAFAGGDPVNNSDPAGASVKELGCGIAVSGSLFGLILLALAVPGGQVAFALALAAYGIASVSAIVDCYF